MSKIQPFVCCSILPEIRNCKGTTSLKKKIISNGHCPLSSDSPPSRLNGQVGPFSGRQKRHFSTYYRIKLKLILIIKMMIFWMSSLSALHCIYIAERQNSYCNTKDIRYSHLHEYSATYSDFYCIPCFASYYAFCEQLSLFLLHKRNPLITSTFAPTPLLWLQKCHPFHDGK